MIKSFKDKDLEELWRIGESKKIRQDLQKRILAKLDYLDVATNIVDLREPPSNHLHKLHGEYHDHWSMAVNGPWRLVFCFIANNAYEVDLVQYH